MPRRRFRKTRKRRGHRVKLDRIGWVKVVVLFLATIIIGRLFYLQIIKGGYYRQVAINNHGLIREIKPQRGEIYVYDMNENNSLHPIVTSKDFYDIYAVPSKIENPEEATDRIIKALHPVVKKFEKDEDTDKWVLKEKFREDEELELDKDETIENNEVKTGETNQETTDKQESKEPEEPTDEELFALAMEEKEILLTRLSKKNDPYEPVRKAVDEEIAKKILDLEIEGIDLASKPLRYYPDGEIFSQITGFWGYDKDERIGRYGIEEYFEDTLKGQKGHFAAEKDAFGGIIPIADLTKDKVKDGADIVLTLDYPIQFRACEELESAVNKYDAESGSILVMDPKTGALLSMCNYPSYNANEYGKVDDINLYLNRAVSYAYEPGSIFKPFTMAAALDSGALSPNDTYNDTGEIKIGPYTIRNSDRKSHGVQTMLEVLQKSLNTGVVHMVDKAGKEVFKEYVNRFGFGRPTEIELPGEIGGNISSLDKKGDIYAATASFGQGITVTPLQIINGFAAIANQGKLMKPYVVDQIVYADGTLEKTQPTEIRQVISADSAITLSAMLASVVEKGYGNKAGVEGYYLAGKTGTAQVPEEEKAGYSNKTIHSFAGFGPVDDPRFVILVKLDKPTAVAFSADSAAPVFKNIAQFIINYYGIEPN